MVRVSTMGTPITVPFNLANLTTNGVLTVSDARLCGIFSGAITTQGNGPIPTSFTGVSGGGNVQARIGTNATGATGAVGYLSPDSSIRGPLQPRPVVPASRPSPASLTGRRDSQYCRTSKTYRPR
jgi:hypothetical protein